MNNFATRIPFLFVQMGAIMILAGCLDSGADTVATDPAPPVPPVVPPVGGNSAPTITGSPGSSVLMDEPYSFTPSASDVDNDQLTFAVSGEPDWLTINSGNGAVTGTPTLADVGPHSGIVVSVSDGSLSASLPQFTIDVVQNADGSVTLSWAAPTLNEDGTALSDLAGYKVYYGTSSRSYTVEIPVDLGTTTLMVDNLTPDTYYFAATAINLADVESQYSIEAVTMVN